MNFHIIILLLAIPPIFTSLAFAAKHRHRDRMPHARAPLQQVWLLKIYVVVTNSSVSPALSHRANSTSCIAPIPVNNVTERLNLALNSSGPGFVLSLCPSAQYMIKAPIVFTAPYQEISTLGYPTDNSRATLVVSGPIINGKGQTTAVDGTCADCDGVILRNIQAGIFVYSIVSSSFTSSTGRWKPCRDFLNPGWGKYRDGWLKLESADRIRAFF